MSQNEFTKLFRYLEEFRAEVNKRFDQNDRAQAETIASIAELGSQIRDYHQELLLLADKLPA